MLRQIMTLGYELSDRLGSAVGSAVDIWYELERGWQAALSGTAIVGLHLLVQLA